MFLHARESSRRRATSILLVGAPDRLLSQIRWLMHMDQVRGQGHQRRHYGAYGPPVPSRAPRAALCRGPDPAELWLPHDPLPQDLRGAAAGRPAPLVLPGAPQRRVRLRQVQRQPWLSDEREGLGAVDGLEVAAEHAHPTETEPRFEDEGLCPEEEGPVTQAKCRP
jgi:hypothetical protein